jgi:HAD superfamily hydrolase (TIGR01509 family)
MQTTTILLDAGGVILDETEDERARVKTAVEVLAGAIPGYSSEMLYADLDEAIALFCPRILAYAYWKHVKPDRAAFDELYKSFVETWRSRRPPLKLMTGFETEVRAISKRLKVGIAGQYGRSLLALLEAEALLDCFTFHFTQDDFRITKPDPRYLEQIATACGVAPQECIMVGDRVDNDIIPAKQVGMKTILVRVGLHKNQKPRTPHELPDVELEGIAGLADAVVRLAEDSG